jgi:hypothetical protein
MSLRAYATNEPSHTSQIVFTVDLFPNYVFHLFALGKIGYESPYYDQYAHTLPERDRAFLHQHHKELLAFGDGSMGKLSVAFLFLPLYLNFPSSGAMDTYFGFLNTALETQDAAAFTRAYNQQLDTIKVFLPFEIGPYLASIVPEKDLVRKLSEIYRANYVSYLEQVWPQEKPLLDEQAEILNTHIAPLELIRQWEEITQMKFKFDTYELALCRAIEGGPNAISVGYERNHFYYSGDLSGFTQFVSHETGTHILIDVFNQMMEQQRYPFPVVYSAYESLALFYNATKIFPDEECQMRFEDYDSDVFLSIYTELTREHPDITAFELLQHGLEHYMNHDKTSNK